MVQVRCPQCASLVEGIEGQIAVCGHCGFKARLPVQPAVSLAPTTTSAPPAVEPTQASAPATSAPPPAVDPMHARPPATSAPPTTGAPAVPTAPAPVLTNGALLAVWSYILGIAAVATFFLANTGLPFAFGAAAVVLGFMARQKEPRDRRAQIGLLLGGAGIVAAIVSLLV